MKKIKSIKQLRAEKRKLRRRVSDLEDKIKYNWADLKQHFTSGRKERKNAEWAQNGEEERTGKKEGFAEDLFVFLIEKVVRKIAGKAEEKFSEWFRK